MLRLATASEPRFEVDDFELTQPPPSYTWMTIRKMKAQLPPHSELFLLIGLDQWQHIESWQHPSRLAEDVTFLVVGRNGHPQQKAGFRALFFEWRPSCFLLSNPGKTRFEAISRLDSS